jgi:hypothetical protein
METYTIKDLLDGNVPNDNLIGTCPICNEPDTCIEKWRFVGIGCTNCLEHMKKQWESMCKYYGNCNNIDTTGYTCLNGGGNHCGTWRLKESENK